MDRNKKKCLNCKDETITHKIILNNKKIDLCLECSMSALRSYSYKDAYFVIDEKEFKTCDKILNDKLDLIIKRLEEIEFAISYIPGGFKYKEAEEHFNELKEFYP